MLHLLRPPLPPLLSLGGRKDYKNAFGNWIRNNYQVINWAMPGRGGYGYGKCGSAGVIILLRHSSVLYSTDLSHITGQWTPPGGGGGEEGRTKGLYIGGRLVTFFLCDVIFPDCSDSCHICEVPRVQDWTSRCVISPRHLCRDWSGSQGSR